MMLATFRQLTRCSVDVEKATLLYQHTFEGYVKHNLSYPSIRVRGEGGTPSKALVPHFMIAHDALSREKQFFPEYPRPTFCS